MIPGEPTSTATRTDGTDLPSRSNDDPGRQAEVALQRFDGCDAFLDYVHTEGAERVGAYGFDKQHDRFEDDPTLVEEGAMEEGASFHEINL